MTFGRQDDPNKRYRVHCFEDHFDPSGDQKKYMSCVERPSNKREPQLIHVLSDFIRDDGEEVDEGAPCLVYPTDKTEATHGRSIWIEYRLICQLPTEVIFEWSEVSRRPQWMAINQMKDISVAYVVADPHLKKMPKSESSAKVKWQVQPFAVIFNNGNVEEGKKPTKFIVVVNLIQELTPEADIWAQTQMGLREVQGEPEAMM